MDMAAYSHSNMCVRPVCPSAWDVVLLVGNLYTLLLLLPGFGVFLNCILITIDFAINTWFERISILVILFNCITLGMYQPCVDDACESNRCKILQVSKRGAIFVHTWEFIF